MKAEVALPFILQAPSRCSSRSLQNFDPFTDPVESLDLKLAIHKRNKVKAIPKLESRSHSWTSALNHRRQAQQQRLSLNLPNTKTASPLQRLAGERGLKSPPESNKTAAPRVTPLGQSSRFILPVRQQPVSRPNMRPTRSFGSRTREARDPVNTGRSPQEHLDSLLIQRGYETTLYRSLDTAFYNEPTEWQMASYGPALVQAVRSGDANRLRELLCHLSANPCTPHGESLMHLVCRRGNLEMLHVLLEHEHALDLCQSVNDHGRTPLHDALWASEPAFDVVRVLLDRNPILLFLKDSSNNTPLSYIPAQQWPAWINFFSRHIDEWFPSTGFTLRYEEAISWVHKPPNFIPLKESPPISSKMATNLAAGKTSVILEWATEEEPCTDQMPEDFGDEGLISDEDGLSSADLDSSQSSDLLSEKRMLVYANFSPAAVLGFRISTRSE